jgi:hypothetical protein
MRPDGWPAAAVVLARCAVFSMPWPSSGAMFRPPGKARGHGEAPGATAGGADHVPYALDVVSLRDESSSIPRAKALKSLPLVEACHTISDQCKWLGKEHEGCGGRQSYAVKTA